MRSLLLTVLLALLWTGLASSARALDEGAAGSEGASPAPTEAIAPDPSADESGPRKSISLALLLGYGVSLESGGNPWGLGFGLRGGFNLDKIYLGARFIYYLGESASVSMPGVGTSTTTSNIWELGIEGGYDIDATDKLVVRPLLGFGLASLNDSASGPAASGSSSFRKIFLAPGVAALYDVTDSVFLGLDARLQIIFGNSGVTSGPSTIKSLVLLANVGMRF